MKVGDKLYCKKGYDRLFADKYYIITDINMNAIYVDGVLFWCNKNIEGEGIMYFGDYFYTNQEYRKMKLDKLNRVSIYKKWFNKLFKV